MAVRSDLADMRLADTVFAPHYAAPLTMAIARTVALRQAAAQDSTVLAVLAPGEGFEALDFAAGSAWGIATGHRLVGYVDRDALTALTVQP